MEGLGRALDGLVKMAIVGFVALVVLAIVAIYSFFAPDIHETKKPVEPEVIIKSVTTKDGQVSDTTYIYTFK